MLRKRSFYFFIIYFQAIFILLIDTASALRLPSVVFDTGASDLYKRIRFVKNKKGQLCVE